MDTKNLARGAAAFAITLTGVLAGAVGLAAYAARRAAGVDLGAGATTPTGSEPMADPRPETGTPGRAEQPREAPAPLNPAAEHAATDLAADEPVTKFSRAPDAFRPDPTAVPTAAEREALRPATGPAPSLAADRSDFAQGLSQSRT